MTSGTSSQSAGRDRGARQADDAQDRDEAGAGVSEVAAARERALTRRDLLGVGLFAAALLAEKPAAARAKVSQAAARYQDRPKNGMSCAACALYRPPAACAVVAGPISRNGWCRFFDLPD
jgi:hypothetical protein